MAGRRLLPWLLACGLVAPAWAIDYLSVAEPGVLYDAPSTKAKPLFVIQRDTPVEMVIATGPWVKVRDADGDLAWIEKSLLSERRTVMVRADKAQIRDAADEGAPLVFEAAKDVVMDLVETAPAGWGKVRARDGQVGFVKASQVWGL